MLLNTTAVWPLMESQRAREDAVAVSAVGLVFFHSLVSARTCEAGGRTLSRVELTR